MVAFAFEFVSPYGDFSVHVQVSLGLCMHACVGAGRLDPKAGVAVTVPAKGSFKHIPEWKRLEMKVRCKHPGGVGGPTVILSRA